MFFRPSFECSKAKIIEKPFKKCGFMMIRRVEICRKTCFFELKMWSKLASGKHTFFKAIFRNRHFVSTGALFAEVPGATNLRKNFYFCSIFYVWMMVVFDGQF